MTELKTYKTLLVEHKTALCLGALLLVLQFDTFNSGHTNQLPIEQSLVEYSDQAKYLMALDEAERESAAQGNQLRILFHRKFQHGFGVSEVEKNLIEEFAYQYGLQPTWVEVDERWELLPAIHQNKGDVIVSQSYEVAGGLEGIVAFTQPWALSKQQLVAYRKPQRIRHLNELVDAEVEIAIKRSSPAWQKLFELSQQDPKLQLSVNVLDENMSEEKILEHVEKGVYEFAILDSEYLKQSINRFPDVNIIFDMPVDQRKTWAVNKNNTKLKKDLNEYLHKTVFATYLQEKRFEDLPDLKQKGVLRAITYQGPTNVFYKNGDLKGFEYELMKRFAESHKLQLNVVFANSHQEMFDLLKQGKGDVITASVPNNSQLQKEFSTTDAYLHSAPVVISRENEPTPIDLFDLSGRSIALPAESPYVSLLNELNELNDLDIAITELEPAINTETLLFLVSLGIHDLTVIPGHTVKAELSRQMNLQATFKLSEPKSLVWVTREQDSVLQDELNNYIAKNYRKAEFNSLKKQYISNPRSYKGDSKLLSKVFSLSPYDDVIKKYSDQYAFDWRLIAAQMYQESQFDPVAISSAGAEGLMQIMPKTAEELGLQDLNDPIANIEAGIRYMSKLRERFEGDLLLMDQNWFALAAYNAGYGRVNKARKLAKQKGLNENKWFGHVEQVMREMANMKNASNKRICRCGQTVVYVRKIRTRYNNYIGLTVAADVASNHPNRAELQLAYSTN